MTRKQKQHHFVFGLLAGLVILVLALAAARVGLTSPRELAASVMTGSLAEWEANITQTDALLSLEIKEGESHTLSINAAVNGQSLGNYGEYSSHAGLIFFQKQTLLPLELDWQSQKLGSELYLKLQAKIEAPASLRTELAALNRLQNTWGKAAPIWGTAELLQELTANTQNFEVIGSGTDADGAYYMELRVSPELLAEQGLPAGSQLTLTLYPTADETALARLGVKLGITRDTKTLQASYQAIYTRTTTNKLTEVPSAPTQSIALDLAELF